jgi:hypothetical protein
MKGLICWTRLRIRKPHLSHFFLKKRKEGKKTPMNFFKKGKGRVQQRKNQPQKKGGKKLKGK